MKTLIMTTFDVGHIGSGHPMTICTIEGERFNVRCRYNHPMNDSANPDHLPAIGLGYDQLRTVATGGIAYGFVEPQGPSGWIDEQIAVRLATLPEYREALSRAGEWFKANGLPVPDPPDAEILPLITPVEL